MQAGPRSYYPDSNSSADLFTRNASPSSTSQLKGYTSDHYSRGSAQKKRKIDRACDACRRRKTKCDGPKMPDNVCSNCAQSRKPCTYVEASKPRGPPKAYITALEDRLESLEGLLKRLRPDHDFTSELGPPIIRDSWKTDETATREPSAPGTSVISTPRTSAVHRSAAASSSRLPSAIQVAKSSSHLNLRKRSGSHATGSLATANDSHDSDYESETSSKLYSSESDGLVDTYTAGMHRLTLRGPDAPAEEDNNHTRFHGKSSSMNLVDATRKLKQQHILQTIDNDDPSHHPSQPDSALVSSSATRRPEYWRFPKWEFVWEGLDVDSPEVLSGVLAKFPLPELAASLFELYFLHINSLFPLLHRPTFERQWKDRLHERNIWFACLSMCIFSVASRWSRDTRVLPNSEQDRDESEVDWSLAGWDFFNVGLQVHRIRRSLFHPATLFEIQTLILLAMFLRGTTSQGSAWTLLTIGLRKAQDAGAHRRTVYNRRPTVEEELWKRAFWHLVGFDRVTSAQLGRACAIGEEDFDLELPLDVEDEFWENDDPQLAFQQPPGKPSKVTAFILWLSLTQIMAFALRTIYAVRPSRVFIVELKLPSSEELVKQLDRALTEWVDSVPDYLKWSKDIADDVFSNQAASLYTSYHLTQVIVHRPFIRPLRPSTLDREVATSSSALAICCSAARSCVRIIERQMERGYSNILDLIHVANVVAAILIIEVWHLRNKERLYKVTSMEDDIKPKYVQTIAELMEDLRVLMRALEWVKPRYANVSAILHLLEKALPDASEEPPDPPKPSLPQAVYTLDSSPEMAEMDVPFIRQGRCATSNPPSQPPLAPNHASQPTWVPPLSSEYPFVSLDTRPPQSRSYPHSLDRMGYHEITDSYGAMPDHILTRTEPPTIKRLRTSRSENFWPSQTAVDETSRSIDPYGYPSSNGHERAIPYLGPISRRTSFHSAATNAETGFNRYQQPDYGDLTLRSEELFRDEERVYHPVSDTRTAPSSAPSYPSYEEKDPRLSELLLALPVSKRKTTPLQFDSTFSTSTPARNPHRTKSASLIEPTSPVATQASTQMQSQTQDAHPHRHIHAPILNVYTGESSKNQESQEADQLATAARYMQNKDYLRVAGPLKPCKSPPAFFMNAYSRFLAHEHNSGQDWHKFDQARRPRIPPEFRNVMELVLRGRSADPFLVYLKALFCACLFRREEAIENALLSIAGFPWCWDAWCLLSSCIADGEELSSLLLLLPLPPAHPLVQIFQIKTLNDLHIPGENEVSLCDYLLGPDAFPGSLWLMSQRACVFFHMHEFSQAERQFERILAVDPQRIENIDIFSNILYVTDNRLRLTKLAHEFVPLGKDRPEVCCLLGNYYSLRGEHAKAVKYFRRAVDLDPSFLSAWTLLGHEYVEMKNSHAAIQAYRRSVDSYRKDYRAWYGLGQAYELVNMHQYALHYYQFSAALRPYDGRLWQGLGQCFEEIGRLREAIECYKRSLISANAQEIHTNLLLANAYWDLEEREESIAYHRRVVDICQSAGRPVHEYAKSALKIAEFQLKIVDGDLWLAHEYAELVSRSNSEDVTRAGELLKSITAAVDGRATADSQTQPTSENNITKDIEIE
uniref:Zn(2)-C6 fungal-type domain-containing protein n=3 Tax=Moniliophthora roreri TaxID=221103 RepID=A0A0W0FGY6_MONRR